MGQNIIAQLGQAITQLLSSQSSTLQATGLDIFRGLAAILIVWFGVKAALSASQGHRRLPLRQVRRPDPDDRLRPGDADVLLDADPRHQLQLQRPHHQRGAEHLATRSSPTRPSRSPTPSPTQEQQLGSPPGSFNILEDLTYLLIAVILAAMEAVAFAVIAYGYVASAVCVLIGPDLHSVVHRAEDGLAVLGMAQGVHRLQLLSGRRRAFIFVFSKVLTAMFQVIGNISISNAFTVLPALLITLFVCIYGLVKIPELTSLPSSAVAPAPGST